MMFVNVCLWKFGFQRMLIAGMGLELPRMDGPDISGAWFGLGRCMTNCRMKILLTLCSRDHHFVCELFWLFDPVRVVPTRQHCWQLIYFLNATAVKRNCQGNWMIRDVYESFSVYPPISVCPGINQPCLFVDSAMFSVGLLSVISRFPYWFEDVWFAGWTKTSPKFYLSRELLYKFIN